MNMTYKEEIAAVSKELLAAAQYLHNTGAKKFHSANLINQFYCMTPNANGKFYRTSGDLQGIISGMVKGGLLLAEEDWTFGMIYSVAGVEVPPLKKPIHELNINDVVRVELGNPGDSNYPGIQELKVERIEKGLVGWRFMGRWAKPNGDTLLCDCSFGKEAGHYYTTLALAYGSAAGRTRTDVVRALNFSPD